MAKYLHAFKDIIPFQTISFLGIMKLTYFKEVVLIGR
jgi:hypothetical protein